MFYPEHERILHIISNAQPNLFKNAANHFTNRIQPMHIPDGEIWEVGIREFSIVNTIQTVPCNIHFIQDLPKRNIPLPKASIPRPRY